MPSFIPLKIAILVISDTRTETNDVSGKLLADSVSAAGHCVVEKLITPDNIYSIRAIIANWIAQDDIDVVISTGGTGVTGRDGTPEAVLPLLDKVLDGFGGNQE